MEYFVGLILGISVGVFNTLVWVEPVLTHQTTPVHIEYAVGKCKQGEWDTIEYDKLTCKDGAEYKLKD